MNSDRVRVLGQLLMEALDEKYPKAEPSPNPGQAMSDAYYRQTRELQLECVHWKATAEKSAKTIRELHEEVKAFQKAAEHAWEATLREREACAKVAEAEAELPGEPSPALGYALQSRPEEVVRAAVSVTKANIAQAIRRRGKP